MTMQAQHFDTIIIGGGPAGMSAALWCADLGINAVLLERERELGGQLLWTFNAITNYLGVEAANGRELRDRFLQHLEKKRVELLTGADVKTVDLVRRSVELTDGRVFSGRSVIIATGVRRRKLGIPGEEEFRGRGILESGVRDRAQVAGKRVVIVGGGDAALENALILSETASRVTVVHRRSVFSARDDFVESVSKRPNITFALDSRITAIRGGEMVESVEILGVRTVAPSSLPADAVLIRVGVVPNTQLAVDQIEIDENGYIRIDEKCGTNVAGIFAIGEVANPTAPTIATAAGMGAQTAFSLLNREL